MGVKLPFGLLTVGLVLASQAFAAPPDVKKDTAAKPATQQAAPAATNEPQKPPVKVTISKETTYITEPLRPDGYPDYVAALNQMASQGVTSENNAAVLFWRAIGPAMIPQEHRTKYFEMLGIEPLPEKGDYFVDLFDYVCEKTRRPGQEILSNETIQATQATMNQLDQVLSRPWSKEEFPLFAEALAANEKQLTLLVEASKRTRRYDPLISKDNSVMGSTWFLGIQSSRAVTRALAARAMLRAYEEKIDESREDLMACHRLARLVGQGPTLVEALVAITIDGIVFRAERALAEQGKLPSQQLLRMRDDLENLPPLPNVAESFNIGERFMLLDAVSRCSRDGLSQLREITDSAHAEGLEKFILDSASNLIDWNIVLRTGNSWFDRLVAACQVDSAAKRRGALAKFSDDGKELIRSRKDGKVLVAAFRESPVNAASDWIGKAFVELFLWPLPAGAMAEDRCAMDLELTKLAFSLAAYRADHGSYPEKLSELVPKYAKAVPKDIFNDADLHYRRENSGYLLYSVGMNEKDDGGPLRNEADSPGSPGDDIGIRIPQTDKPQK